MLFVNRGKTCQQKKFLNWTKNDAADSMEKRERFAFLLVHYFPSTKMRGELEIDLVRFPLFIRRMLCQINGDIEKKIPTIRAAADDVAIT